MVNDAMIWMNSKMNQQSKLSLTVEPAVKVREIQDKTKVRLTTVRLTLYSTAHSLQYCSSLTTVLLLTNYSTAHKSDLNLAKLDLFWFVALKRG